MWQRAKQLLSNNLANCTFYATLLYMSVHAIRIVVWMALSNALMAASCVGDEAGNNVFDVDQAFGDSSNGRCAINPPMASAPEVPKFQLTIGDIADDIYAQEQRCVDPSKAADVYQALMNYYQGFWSRLFEDSTKANWPGVSNDRVWRVVVDNAVFKLSEFSSQSGMSYWMIESFDYERHVTWGLTVGKVSDASNAIEDHVVRLTFVDADLPAEDCNRIRNNVRRQNNLLRRNPFDVVVPFISSTMKTDLDLPDGAMCAD